MSQLRKLTMENLESRRLLAVDVLGEIEPEGEARFIPRDLFGFNGNVYLRMNDGNSGPEPWVTDGTPESTRLLKDIQVGNFGSGARSFAEYNGRLYFAANNGFSGLELWGSDGTKATTQQIADIWAGSENAAPTELTVFNNLLYFFANDGATGRELYSSDGTTLGTGPLADSVPGLDGSSGENLMVIGDQMFFASDSTSADAAGIWVSDGTADGTRRVPIDGIDPENVTHLTPFGDRLVFSSAGRLWVTDGTSEGSQQVPASSEFREPTSVAALGDKLYVTSSAGVHEITNSLADARLVSPLAEHVTVRDGKAYFWNSAGLFVVSPDGSPTSLVQFNALFGSRMGTTDEVPGGMIFNFKRALDRYEIWVTDGTPAGTKMLERVRDTSNESFAQFKQIGDRVYFTATNGQFHESVWTIPAPVIDVVDPGIPGDFNGDKLRNAADIDALHAAIASNSLDTLFDLNGDSTVSSEDVDYLVTELLQTRRGDVDLNGKVDFADFLKLSGSFGRNDTGWADGDIDGDGKVAFADFLSLSANFGFDSLEDDDA